MNQYVFRILVQRYYPRTGPKSRAESRRVTLRCGNSENLRVSGLRTPQRNFLLWVFQKDHFGIPMMLKTEGSQCYCILKIAEILSYFADWPTYRSNVFRKMFRDGQDHQLWLCSRSDHQKNYLQDQFQNHFFFVSETWNKKFAFMYRIFSHKFQNI